MVEEVEEVKEVEEAGVEAAEVMPKSRKKRKRQRKEVVIQIEEKGMLGLLEEEVEPTKDHPREAAEKTWMKVHGNGNTNMLRDQNTHHTGISKLIQAL